MATIKNFVYCLNTDNSNDVNNVFGVLAAMTPEYIPGLFSFSVYFTVLDLDVGEYQLTLKFRDADGAVAASVDNATINYQLDQQSNLPKEYMGLNIAVNLQNVNITHSGLYWMDVIINGEKCGEFDIFVKGKNERL